MSRGTGEGAREGAQRLPGDAARLGRPYVSLGIEERYLGP